jgi:ATP-dependent RNA helicase DDX47/RRP3
MLPITPPTVTAHVRFLQLMLRNLGYEAVCLHGQLSQPRRLGEATHLLCCCRSLNNLSSWWGSGALNKFKAGQRNILVATDVAARGLDIPDVDVVLNFDIPSHGKDYIHRVGRTARAGKAGRSVSFVTQYDVEAYQRLEELLGLKLPEVSIRYTCCICDL